MQAGALAGIGKRAAIHPESKAGGEQVVNNSVVHPIVGHTPTAEWLQSFILQRPSRSRLWHPCVRWPLQVAPGRLAGQPRYDDYEITYYCYDDYECTNYNYNNTSK